MQYLLIGANCPYLKGTGSSYLIMITSDYFLFPYFQSYIFYSCTYFNAFFFFPCSLVFVCVVIIVVLVIVIVFVFVVVVVVVVFLPIFYRLYTGVRGVHQSPSVILTHLPSVILAMI